MHARERRQPEPVRKRLDLQGKMLQIQRHRRRPAGQELRRNRPRVGQVAGGEPRRHGQHDDRERRQRRMATRREHRRRMPDVVLATAGLTGQSRRCRIDVRRGLGVVAARVLCDRHRRGGQQDRTRRAMPAETQDIQTKQLHKQRQHQRGGQKANGRCWAQSCHNCTVCRVARGCKRRLHGITRLPGLMKMCEDRGRRHEALWRHCEPMRNFLQRPSVPADANTEGIKR